MEVRLEYYRAGAGGEPDTVISKVTRQAGDVEEAARIGRELAATLDLPHPPDGMTIRDAKGKSLWRQRFRHLP